MKHKLNLVGLALTLLLPVLMLANQSEAPPPASPDKLDKDDKQEQDRKEGAPRFRAEVDQVVIYLSVSDPEGQLVSGLAQDQFTVFENRIEQQITYFGQDDIPSTLGIVFDRSGSMRNKIDLVNEAAQLFVAMNNPLNELFLITFDDEVMLEENFTRDIYDIKDALDNIVVSGGTALYDAIHLAVDKATKGAESKKAVVVFTDGEDKDSYYRHEELLDKIRESDVQVYIVAFLDPDLSDSRGIFGVFKSKRNKVEEKIQNIAEYTGGKAFFPEKIEDLAGTFASIAEQLRSQYRLAYVSSNPSRNGAWRRIDIALAKAQESGWRVRAKRGYLAR